MPTEVSTMCFHTRDAVERRDASYTFELPADRLRTGAVKVALASCEFPMVQWTVEEDWNRLWLSEGVQLEPCEVLCLVARLPGAPEPAQPVVLAVPPRLNKVVRAGRSGTALVCECEYPHGLWSAAGAPVTRGATLVGGRGGDVALGAAARVSETTLQIEDADGAGGGGAEVQDLWVLTPPPASPKHLCDWLTVAARGAFDPFGLKVAFAYDACTDRVVLRAVADVPRTLLRVLPTPFAHRLGLSTAPLRLADGAAHDLPSAPTALWDYVEIPPGFYAPCHRPMGTGQPMRLGNEVEAAVNRLYFPLAAADRLPAGASTPHLLVFADGDGHAHTCPIPCGRYTPATLCAHLEAKMSEASGLLFSVTHEEERYVFRCERRTARGVVTPCPFGLLFHHPLSLDPARLGFPAQPLAGSDTYVAPERTRAYAGSGNNVLRLSELGAQKRFRVHAAQPPPLACLVEGKAQQSGSGVRLRTYVNQLPFAHGYRAGDAVRLSATDAQRLGAVDARASAAALPADSACTCLVVESGSDDPCVLVLRAPRLEGVADPGTCLQVAADAAPFNLCFCKPRTLTGHMMGFPEKAVLWGVDGSIADGDGALRPPFVAPGVHNLDHPDSINITFSEQGGATLEHTHRGVTQFIFAKIVAYPSLREERMLPRDTLLQRDQLSRFTLSFWNPDMRTPYRFHGTDFTFSLNFVSALPD